MIEESYQDDFIMPPLYYLGKWQTQVTGITKNNSMATAYLYYKNDPRPWIHPNSAIFFGKDNIANRIGAFKKMFPHNDSIATIYPSFLDNVLEWLNPVNKNQTTYIYHFTEQDVYLPDSASTKSGH